LERDRGQSENRVGRVGCPGGEDGHALSIPWSLKVGRRSHPTVTMGAVERNTYKKGVTRPGGEKEWKKSRRSRVGPVKKNMILSEQKEGQTLLIRVSGPEPGENRF